MYLLVWVCANMCGYVGRLVDMGAFSQSFFNLIFETRSVIANDTNQLTSLAGQ